MTINKSVGAVLAALALGCAGVASADIVTLDFEGVGNLSPVGDFYSGLGITFSLETLAVVDEDAGGNGNFANEPSPNTVMFFLDAAKAVLNVSNGFSGGFSFYYSTAFSSTVTVFEGANGSGEKLGSIDLTPQFEDNCSGDPNGQFCNWTATGLNFAGIAKSISFAGAANGTGFDNITFGSAVPGPGPGPGNVPEPASLALVGAALLGLAAMRRRKA